MSEAKPQDGSTVKGYRTLSEQDIADMNSVKGLAVNLSCTLKGCVEMGQTRVGRRSPKRIWACMAACRAVAQPDGDC